MASTSKQITFTVSTVPTTALSSAASGLAVGANSTTGISNSGLNTTTTEQGWVVNWHARHHYDAAHKCFRFVGKEQQSTGGSARHLNYDEAGDVWTASSGLWSAETGHIYEQSAFDRATGDLYSHTQDNGPQLRKWTFGADLSTWNDSGTSSASSILATIPGGNPTTRFCTAEGGCAFHPNLFGADQAGIVVLCQRGVVGWRKSTNTWHLISGLYSLIGDTPSCCYVAGLDAVIVTNGDTLKAWRITQGPTVTAINDTPVHFGPGSAFNHAVLVDDPQQRTTCYALERLTSTAAGTRRVWRYNSGAWDLQAYGHPFFSTQTSGEDISVCAVYGYGVIHALERVNNNLRSNLWKPNT